jgi:hypothetical protein
LTAEGRKSVEPMAAVTAPAQVFGAASEALAFRRRRKVVGRRRNSPRATSRHHPEAECHAEYLEPKLEDDAVYVAAV